MTIEQEYAEACKIADPVAKLVAICAVSNKVDSYRSMLAEAKGITALCAANQGATQRVMAEAVDVSNAMVQQWVKRGREATSADPF